LRVLIVHDFGTPSGGAENMSLSLRSGLRARGHDARFFASRARPLPLENVADYTCLGTTGPARRVLQVANPWAARRLGVVLREFSPEVVHVRMFLNQLSPLILPQLRGLRSLLHVVNYDLICPLNTKLLPDGSSCHHKAGMACRRAGCLPLLGVARTIVQTGLHERWRNVFRMIVTNSEWTAQRLRAEGIAVHETISNGVPLVDQRPPLGDPPTVAYAGRLVQKKGVDVLLRAMKDVTAAMPAAKLLLAGDGPERASLERLIDELGLRDCVSVLGHRPRRELEDLLATAWVQAVPSRWEEPFGLVAAEAMMRGSAVVASRAGGLREQVVDGETGVTIPAGDAAALSHALLRVLGNRELAESMGRRGRARALAQFTEDRVVDRFEAVYEQLVATS
jgi:glycosyltransferase involved in cell wall biosynthesis